MFFRHETNVHINTIITLLFLSMLSFKRASLGVNTYAKIFPFNFHFSHTTYTYPSMCISIPICTCAYVLRKTLPYLNKSNSKVDFYNPSPTSIQCFTDRFPSFCLVFFLSSLASPPLDLLVSSPPSL